MSITLNNSDFQCLQDQLVDLKAKNYELAERNRRSQADFEAAKAKVCTLQLKLEEQERDFQIVSTTLRREIESLSSLQNTIPSNNNAGGGGGSNSKKNDANTEEEDYKVKYKKLMNKAKELQQRYEKSVEIVQQLDSQNKNLTERLRDFEVDDNEDDDDDDKTRSEKKETTSNRNSKNVDVEKRIAEAIEEYKQSGANDVETNANLEAITAERDSLKEEIVRLIAEIEKFDQRLENQNEERKIQERKGLQIVKELKRQLAIEKNRTETLQQRLEELLSQSTTVVSTTADELIETEAKHNQLSTSSSTNGNSSSNGNGNGANNETNSIGSWSFVPVKTSPTTKSSSNAALNETLSLCSIASEDRETVQHPSDTNPETSMQRVASDVSSKQTGDPSISATTSSPPKKSLSSYTHHDTIDAGNRQNLSSLSSYASSHQSNNNIGDGMLLEEQAALVERLTKLQHDKWMLEEKLSYMEQANSSLSEDLANKSEIIRQYFKDQALRAINSAPSSNQLDPYGNNQSFNLNNSTAGSRRISFPTNVNHLITEKPSLKKVVDFLKERSQVGSSSAGDSENISREATKKMQLMLEETLIKCLKLQENLDFVTNEMNKLKT